VSRRLRHRPMAVLALWIVSAGCGHYRGTQVYEVPAGFVGWVRIKYGDPSCAALPLSEGQAVRRISPSGVLCTNTPFREGWGPNRYFEVGRDRATIPTSGEPADRRIWSPMTGETSSDAGSYRIEVFFVGTWAQHEATPSGDIGNFGPSGARDPSKEPPDNKQMQRTRPG
jgi:hypothetical protein